MIYAKNMFTIGFLFDQMYVRQNHNDASEFFWWTSFSPVLFNMYMNDILC